MPALGRFAHIRSLAYPTRLCIELLTLGQSLYVSKYRASQTCIMDCICGSEGRQSRAKATSRREGGDAFESIVALLSRTVANVLLDG